MYQCISIRKKGSTEQCLNKKKVGYDFCGVHLRCKCPIIFKQVSPPMVSPPMVSPPTVSPPTVSPPTVSLPTVSPPTVSPPTVSLKLLIKLQANIRRYLVKRRKNCFNDSDFYTLDSLLIIPTKYYIQLNNYGFDIRSINEYIKETKQNPYTREDFKDKELYAIYNRISMLNNNELNIIDIKMTPEQQFESEVLLLFQKINKLDNYADNEWFMSLSIKELHTLYLKIQDMWIYRLQITSNERCNIVKNGIICELKLTHILYNTEYKRYLQNIILNTVNRLITEGKTLADKKCGAMIFLSSLVEVSQKAAIAMPWYVQSNF